jgi:erythromycin esterase
MKNLLSISTALILSQFAFGQSTTEPLAIGKQVEKQLHSNERQIYALPMAKNSVLELTLNGISVDIAIDALDTDKKKIKTFDSDQIVFTAPAKGIYYFAVYPFINTQGASDSLIAAHKKGNQGSYEISSSSYYTETEYEQKQAGIRAKKEKTISWIRQNAFPLKSVKAENGFEDLMPLKGILKDVQIVGLGEATHGTKEFFQMKHRMLEFLVKEMGFTVFVMEASYAGCSNINNYVLYGKYDATRALASQGMLVWDTEEVLDMIEWLRRYNQTVPDENKVRFKGIDFRSNYYGGSFYIIKQYIKKVDPQLANQTDSLIGLVEKTDIQELNGINTDSCKNEFLKLIDNFSLSKENYAQLSSIEEYKEVFQRLKIIGQSLTLNFCKGDNPQNINTEKTRLRDYYMASNLIGIVQEEKPDTKYVLWAHNGHISKEEPLTEENPRVLGNYLKEAYGDKYYAFGFSFNKGSFQSFEYAKEMKPLGMQEFTVTEDHENTLDWYFSQTGLNPFIINFRRNQLPDYMNDFVNQRLLTRTFGGQLIRENAETSNYSIDIRKSYDAIIFIDNTTRAMLLFK